MASTRPQATRATASTVTDPDLEALYRSLDAHTARDAALRAEIAETSAWADHLARCGELLTAAAARAVTARLRLALDGHPLPPAGSARAAGVYRATQLVRRALGGGGG